MGGDGEEGGGDGGDGGDGEALACDGDGNNDHKRKPGKRKTNQQKRREGYDAI